MAVKLPALTVRSEEGSLIENNRHSFSVAVKKQKGKKKETGCGKSLVDSVLADKLVLPSQIHVGTIRDVYRSR
ncbi:MAG: hypothetical protein ABIB93_06890 [Chloroflexota bacterium]